MVSTRHHPSEFPPPEASPTKASPRKSSRRSTTSPTPETPNSVSPIALTKRAVSNAVASANGTASTPSSNGWSHTASNITIAWITVSLPLVIWDSLYILLRPHTMAGGKLQWPIWSPYEIYADIDHVYGWPGWDNHDGFGGAQGALNAVEAVLYGLYISIIYNHGIPAVRGRGVQAGEGIGAWISGGRRVEGRRGNQALVIGFAAAVMTLSKTVLYYFNEYFAHFENTKHNDWMTLIIFYGIMNGLWVVFSAYMTVVFGADLLEGLNVAAESSAVASKKNF